MNQDKEKQIKAILAELYAIDANFKNYQDKLEKIILELLSAKPEVKFDEEFKQQLLSELLIRAKELKISKPVRAFRWADFFSTPKFAYAFSGAIIALLVLVPVIYFANKSGYFLSRPQAKLTPDISITRTADNAFGPLFSQEQLGEAVGLGGGGGVSAIGLKEGVVPAPAPVPGEVTVIRPDFISYHYVYKGDEFTLENEKVEVLRREKGQSARSGIRNLLSSMDFGAIDLSTFKNLEVKRIELSQDKDLGYSMYIDFYEGTFSISRNYRKWLPGIMESSPLRATDIPDDAKLIEVADSFIREHKINMTNYGAPMVNRYWENQTMSYAEEMSYISEEVSVIYPLIINGRKVYDQGGSQFGITMSISVREMKVSGLYNLTSQSYQTSSYEAETDVQRILEIAEKGGLYGGYLYYGYGRGEIEGGNIVEAGLGTPEVVFMRFMTYEDYQDNELLVPALLFPIAKTAEGKQIFRQNIIVPLAKELLQGYEGSSVFGPVPVPMPAPEPAPVEIRAEE